jgi:protein-S-isoprenylcysteine O-methyltransferase Ste14
METPHQKKPLPPVYFFALLGAIGALHLWLPLKGLIPAPWNLLGVVPILVGAALNVAADTLFKKHKTTVKPFKDSNALVTTGVYRWTRNPMYLGLVLILSGVACLAGSLSAFLPPAAFAILMDKAFIKTEEEMLSARFPEQWQQYRSCARRWV